MRRSGAVHHVSDRFPGGGVDGGADGAGRGPAGAEQGEYRSGPGGQRPKYADESVRDAGGAGQGPGDPG